jgi:hypothetical protein
MTLSGGGKLTGIACAGVVAIQRQSDDPSLQILEKRENGSMRLSVMGEVGGIKPAAFLQQYDVPAGKINTAGLSEQQVIQRVIKESTPDVRISATAVDTPLTRSTIECAESELKSSRRSTATSITRDEAMQAMGAKLREVMTANPDVAKALSDLNGTVIDDRRGKVSFNELMSASPPSFGMCTNGKNIER